MKRDNIRLAIAFAEGLALDVVDGAVESNFGGLGGVVRTDDPRKIILEGIYWPYNYQVVTAQLTQMQKDGMLTWEEVISPDEMPAERIVVTFKEHFPLDLVAGMLATEFTGMCASVRPGDDPTSTFVAADCTRI